jgi:ankyrin repeat protein
MKRISITGLLLVVVLVFPGCIRTFGHCISIIHPEGKIKVYKKKEQENKNGMTALMLAAGNDDSRIVQRLLDQGAQINAKDKKGQTALMLASMNAYLDTVEILLAGGADINVQNNNGATALTLAAMKGHTTMVKYLLDKNPDLTLKTNGGLTALDAAELNNQKKVVEILNQHGAARNIMPKPVQRSKEIGKPNPKAGPRPAMIPYVNDKQ